MESDFGKGLTYCIGLFLGHVCMFEGKTKEALGNHYATSWFNAASDHLYELEIGPSVDDELKADILEWRKKVLHWGHSFPMPEATEKDVEWAIEKAKYFLREIDEKLLGVEAIKGQWE